MKTVVFLFVILNLLACEDPMTRNSGKSKKRSEVNLPNIETAKQLPSEVYYRDHIIPLFQKSCLPCHGSGNKRNWMDYDRTTEYAQDILGSLQHEENYLSMPIGRPKLAAEKIQLIQDWIEQGMLEKSPHNDSPIHETEKVTEPMEPLDDPIKIGEGLYKSNCAACHDTNQLYPGLKGQNKNYIIQQLENFKTGYRSNPVMSYYANEVVNDSKSIEFIASYLSQLKPCYKKTTPIKIKLLPTDSAPNSIHGKKLYETNCKVCHTRDHSLNNPYVLGLNGNYAVKILTDFKNNFRASSAMAPFMRKFSRQDILDISSYISQESDCKQSNAQKGNLTP